MAQVFVSYAHVSPDQDLASEVSSLLEKKGHTVFVDTKILIGQDWVEQIDVQLRKSEYFVVLLSAASVASDMVRREIALAYRLRKAKKLTILPVRLGFEGELPYDIAAYLDTIQQAFWNPGRSFESVGSTILNAIEASGQHGPEMPRPPEAPLRAHGSAAVASSEPRPQRFDPDQLDRLRRELETYIGPVARILVKRAAEKAVTWQQLYEMLSAEVPAGEERKRFLRTRPR